MDESEPVASTRVSLEDAWTLCYADPVQAAATGEQLAALGAADPATSAWGWWHVALASVRLGRVDDGLQALAQARVAFVNLGDVVGQALCEEIDGIACRIAGDIEQAGRLMDLAEAQGDPGFDPLQRFIAHNSRAITCKVLGRMDDTLRHFLLALAAAETSGNLGARLTALSNLGGFQQDLYNLDDACLISEKALVAARLTGMPRNIGLVANNLVVVYHALGQHDRAHEMARELLALRAIDDSGTLLRFGTSEALGHLSVGLLDEAEALLTEVHHPNPGDTDGHAYRAWVRMRCALARGRPAEAREIGDALLQERAANGRADVPYDLMELHLALADACEALGDVPAALAGLRHAHGLYVQLVGRSARARRIALEVGFDLARTQRERDTAIQKHQRSEADRLRLAELNAALQGQIEANERLQKRLLEQALHDPLTGLHNRRYLYETAPAMLELARRQGSPLSVVLLDLDHFKQFNDTHGHQAGDRLLQAFAQRARAMLRRSDLLCRYGGEEFVAVMPDIDAEGAYTVLGRLLEACLAQPLADGHTTLPLSTFSAGIALFPQHADTLEHLLQKSDLALYAAKGLGRARIEIAPISRPGTLN